MTRYQLRKIIKTRRGEMARIAEAANVSPSVVTEWFDGRTNSPEVGRLIAKRAGEIAAEREREEMVTAEAS
jgi:hypothetical protein